MFKFDRIDRHRSIVAGIGALFLSAACVAAAVAPAPTQQVQTRSAVSHA